MALAGGKPAELALEVGVVVGVDEPACPAVVEDVLERGEGLGALGVDVGPVGAEVEAPGPVDQLAGGVARRQAAPAGVVAVSALVASTEVEQGLVGQVHLESAVASVALLEVAVEGAVAGVGGAEQPAADRAALVQRAGDVGLHPAAGRGGDGGGDLAAQEAGRALADVVDRGARLAGALHQAGGAAHDLDVVIEDHVVVVVAELPDVVPRDRHPVVLVGVDRKAAGIVVLPLAVEGDHGDAGGGVERLADRGDVAVLHLRVGDDAGGLRGLALGER